MRLLSAQDVETALPMKAWVDAMEPAFLALSDEKGCVMKRQSLPLRGGTGLVMAASGPAPGLMVKVVSVMPGNTARGLPGTVGNVMLMDGETGQPRALIEGSAFTAWRTAALVGCATRALARTDSRVALVLGCGAQAKAQLLTLDALFTLDEIRVLGRSPGQAEHFLETMARHHELPARAVQPGAGAFQGVDIVVTATNSAEPVFAPEWVAPGCHVSALGSFQPSMQELPPALLANASIFVETRQTALEEAGELIAAQALGVTGPEQWTEFGEVLSGARPGRRQAQEITVFKSVGHALFDLHAAQLIVETAEQSSLGEVWNP